MNKTTAQFERTRSTGALGRKRRTGFTLIELLVVMGIIVILIGITVVSVGAIARGSQLASATNSVKSALGTARALALKNRKPTGVVFRVDWDPNRPTAPQVTEAVFVEDAGNSLVPFGTFIVNRYVEVQGTEREQLPVGMKVAGPSYVNNTDGLWITQPQFPAAAAGNEPPGRLLGVLFDKNGSMITMVPESDANVGFVDFNNNNAQDSVAGFDDYEDPDEEPNIIWAPFVAVYDDAEAREYEDDSDWNVLANYEMELKSYIDEFANRIHFNRYTGVVMK